MTKKINCIMLIDDNEADNFFHARIIKKSGSAVNIIIKERAKEALEYLKSKQNRANNHPDLIFLDINMPGIDGWGFLEEYNKLDRELQSQIVITMLTTSENPDDKIKALSYNTVADFKTKPLTKEVFNNIIEKYFGER